VLWSALECRTLPITSIFVCLLSLFLQGYYIYIYNIGLSVEFIARDAVD
jgi:hypothetical protein